MKLEELLQIAKEASEGAYCPYSEFPVGAALLCRNGEIITGVNIENRSYGLTNCAERTAIFTAVSEGKKRGDFEALAVYGPKATEPLSPCGACRQVISEFMEPDCSIIFSGKDTKKVKTTVKKLFPFDTLHNLTELK